jgi:hypothetical protein
MKPVRRLPIVVALAVALLAAVAAGNHDAATSARPGGPSDAAAIAPAGATATAWFCPGVPTPVAADRENISVANTGDRATDVDITVMPDDGSDPLRQAVSVAAHSVQVINRPALGVAGGVVVESFSRSIVVESSVEAADQLDMNPCATTTSRDWYFASGTTVRGAEQWLVLFNPLGIDAKVDLTFATDAGRKAPSTLQGVDVARRSRVMLKINDDVQNQARNGVEIKSRVGRVVAEQTIVFDARSGATGLARTLGVVAPSRSWVFPYARSINGSTTRIEISNPGSRDAEVSVQVVTTKSDSHVAPFVAVVGAQHAAAVQIGGCTGTPGEACVAVDDDLTYAVQLDTDVDQPIVAEETTTRADAGSEVGVTNTSGTARGARTWLFARSRVADEHGAVLALVNSGGAAVRASVALVHDGKVDKLPELQGVTVAPSRPTIITLNELAATDAAVIVTATGPIAAQRMLFGAAEQAVSPGVVQR